MRPTRIACFVPLAALILAHGSCDRVAKVVAPASALVGKGPAATPAGPSEEDMRIARDVMTIADVFARLKSNIPNPAIIAEVKHRRIPQVIVEGAELELAAHGAGHLLLDALKDPKNTLTEAQDKVYSQLLGEKTRSAPKAAKTR